MYDPIEDSDHPQKSFVVYDQENRCERHITCDEELEELIFALNEIGAVTTNSCCNLNNSGAIQIMFDHRVPVQILRHAIDIIGAAYPTKNIVTNLNSVFDIEVLAFEIGADISIDILVRSFYNRTGTTPIIDIIKMIQEPQKDESNESFEEN